MFISTIYAATLATLLVLISSRTSSPVALLHSPDARPRLSAPSPACRPEIHPVPSGRTLTVGSASRRRSAFATLGRNPRLAHAERPPDSVPRPT